MKSRLVNLIFCLIWIGFACIFGKLAVEARRAESIRLARVWFEVPPGIEIGVDNFNPVKTLTLIAKTTNENISHLENSMQQSLHLSFVLNTVSGFLALLGFVAQVFQYLVSEKYHKDEIGEKNKNPSS